MDLMKKTGLIFVLLMFITTGLVIAQDAACIVFVSGRPGDNTALQAEFKKLNSNGNRVTIKVRNRLRNEDLEITSVEVKGLNARGVEVTETVTGSSIRMDDGGEPIIGHGERLDIQLRLRSSLRSVSEVKVYADVCRL
jgi:hypothetical protein